MFQCNRLDLTSSSTVTSVKMYGNAFPHQKMYGNIVPTRFHPTTTWSCDKQPTICRDNWLGFKSLWLGFRIGVYVQDVGSNFKLRGSVFRVRV